jgi:predicted lipoprotein with Yx(FWY)xxD motif
MILVNSRGFTIYAFTRDGRNSDNCARVSGCLSVWPPVTSSGTAIAGRGVNPRLIGAITLRNGIKQVTYAGRPLYTYVADSGPGQTFYVNVSQFGGRWPAVNAAGNEVK